MRISPRFRETNGCFLGSVAAKSNESCEQPTNRNNVSSNFVEHRPLQSRPIGVYCDRVRARRAHSPSDWCAKPGKRLAVCFAKAHTESPSDARREILNLDGGKHGRARNPRTIGE